MIMVQTIWDSVCYNIIIKHHLRDKCPRCALISQHYHIKQSEHKLYLAEKALLCVMLTAIVSLKD